MKKLLCICAALWLLFALCAAPVFAAEDSCTICDDFALIMYEGKMYPRVDFQRVELLDETNITQLEHTFERESDALRYYYTGVTRSEEHPHILFARYGSTNGNFFTAYFVEDSRYKAVQNFIADRSEGEHYTPSERGDMPIGEEDLLTWLKSEETLSVPPVEMEYESSHKLIRKSTELGLSEHVGDILSGYDENGEPVFYLVYYPHYSKDYFYASGSFSMEGTREADFLRLTDGDTASRLAAFYDMTPPDTEDELDWVVPGDVPEEVASVIALILFGILPVALMAFALVWIFVKQPKNPYFAALCVIIFAAAEVAIAYVALALLLQ